MIKEIKLPEISDNVDTADVISVLVKKGDTVDIDQSLIEVETDKASFDVPSTEKGIVTDVFVKENETINVGHIIITVETGGAEPRGLIQPEPESFCYDARLRCRRPGYGFQFLGSPWPSTPIPA